MYWTIFQLSVLFLIQQITDFNKSFHHSINLATSAVGTHIKPVNTPVINPLHNFFIVI